MMCWRLVVVLLFEPHVDVLVLSWLIQWDVYGAECVQLLAAQLISQWGQ